MSEYCNKTYEYVKVLEERLILLKGKIANDVYDKYDKSIKDIKQKLIDLPDNPSISRVVPIINELQCLETKFNSELSNQTKNAVKKSILSQVDILEDYILQDLEMVEKVLGQVDNKLQEVKDIYDDVEYDDLERKLLGILVKCNIERIKKGKGIDEKSIKRLSNDSGYSLLTSMLAERGENAEGLEKVLVESWLMEIVDIKTGLLDKTRLGEIIGKTQFWGILAGCKEAELKKGDDKSNLDEVNTKSYDQIREEQISEIASTYGIKSKKLKVYKNNMLLIVEKENRNGKKSYKIVEKPSSKWQGNDFKDAVAVIFADDVQYIPGIPNYDISIIDKEDIVSIINRGGINRKKLKYVVLPGEVIEIGAMAFTNSSVESMHLPSTLKEIGEGAFSYCDSLSRVTFNEGLLSIGSFAFSESGIEEFIMPSTLEYLNSGVFLNCEELKNVELRNGITSIDEYCFENTSIKKINIPDSVSKVGEEAFFNCSNLEEVSGCFGLKQIDWFAFFGTKLKRISLPKDAKYYPSQFPEGCVIELKDKNRNTNVRNDQSDKNSGGRRASAEFDWC